MVIGDPRLWATVFPLNDLGNSGESDVGEVPEVEPPNWLCRCAVPARVSKYRSSTLNGPLD